MAHNKLFVADDAIAITGGPNIGDQYFTRDPHSNLSIWTGGRRRDRPAAVRGLPMRSGTASTPTPSHPWPRRCGRGSPAALDEAATSAEAGWLAAGEIDADALHLNWVPASAWSTNPPRSPATPPGDPGSHDRQRPEALCESAAARGHRHLPYFVPAMTAVALMRELVMRGVPHPGLVTNRWLHDSPLVHNEVLPAIASAL